MRRLIFSGLLALLLVAGLLGVKVSVPSAHAIVQTAVRTHGQLLSPDNSGGNCSGQCWGKLQWAGNVHGAAADWYVSLTHGTYTCSTAFCEYERILTLVTSTEDMQVGYAWCVDGTPQGSCASGAGLTPGVLYYNWSWNNSNEQWVQVPSGDINQIVHFQINYYTSNGGGMQFWIQGPSGYTCQGGSTANCYVQGFNQTWSDIQLVAHVGGNFTGAFANTVDDYNNKWQDTTNGSWHYQTSNGSIIQGDNPPWIGWVYANDPAHSSTGGELYDCSIVATNNPC